MRNKYSITPVLRKDKLRADGKMPIVIQVIINGKTYKRSAGEYITSNDWNEEDKKLKKGVDRAGIINNRIKNAIIDLEEHLNRAESFKGSLTIDDVREFYEGEKKVYMYGFWEEQIQKMKKDLRPSMEERRKEEYVFLILHTQNKTNKYFLILK